jgi:hypothetical protein
MRLAPLKGSPEEKIERLQAENAKLLAALQEIAGIDIFLGDIGHANHIACRALKELED